MLVAHDVKESLWCGVLRDQLQIRHCKFEQGDFLNVRKVALLIATDPNIDLEDNLEQLIEGQVGAC